MLESEEYYFWRNNRMKFLNQNEKYSLDLENIKLKNFLLKICKNIYKDQLESVLDLFKPKEVAESP